MKRFFIILSLTLLFIIPLMSNCVFATTSENCITSELSSGDCLHIQDCEDIHSFIVTSITPATCLNSGSKHLKCENCGLEKDELINALGHTEIIDEAVAPTCKETGLTEGSHCSVCNEIIIAQVEVAKLQHKTVMRPIVTPATLTSNGRIDRKKTCIICNTMVSNNATIIPKIASVKLNKTSVTYNGKVQSATVIIKDSEGKVLRNQVDYTLSKPKGLKSVGKYTYKVIFKYSYEGTSNLTLTIKPKTTSISKVTPTKKGFKICWKEQLAQTTGYQIQYTTNSEFSTPKTVTIKNNKTTSEFVSNLKTKNEFYVRVRTYKTVKGTKIYSSWSKPKKVTIK